MTVTTPCIQAALWMETDKRHQTMTENGRSNTYKEAYMKTSPEYAVLVSAILFSLYALAQAAPHPEEAPSPNQLAQYGMVTNVATLTNGFVFIGSHYLDAPYHVTQQGLGVYINDRLVDRVCVLAPVQSITSPPTIPASVSTNTILYSDEVCAYRQQVTLYCKQNMPPEEEYSKKIELLRLLPCVREIVYNETTTEYTMRSFRGEELCGILKPLGRKGIESTQDALQALARMRCYYEQSIHAGQVIMFAKGGSTRMQIPPMAVKRELPAILLLRNRNIKSAAPESRVSAQAQAVAQAGLRIDEKILPDLLTNFTASTQLEQRIGELLKQ
jgi:hypothetical protein